MAKYNEILTGRHNRFIQKLFGMKGGPPAPQLSGDIQMSHAFFHGSENRFLETWYRWSATILIAANAANVASFQLLNRKTTGVVGVLEKLIISNGGAAAGEFDVSLQTGAAASDFVIFASIPLDGRQPFGSQSPISASSSTFSQSSLTIIGRPFIPPNGSFDFIIHEDHEIVIVPDTSFRVIATVANQAMLITAFWRERALEEGEFK